MDSRQILQCIDCVESLDKYIALDGSLSQLEQDILANYTLFLELNRLRKFKVNKSPMPNIKFFEDTLYPLNTITC